MELTIGLSQEQQVRVSPSLIILNEILQLSSAELQDEIRRELEANPALEMDERRLCPTCGGSYLGSTCQRCLNDKLNKQPGTYTDGTNKSTSDDYNNNDYYGAQDSWSGSGGGGGSFDGDEEFDLLTIVAAEMPLTERILADLSTILPEEDMQIAEFLIGSLDERGYLATTIDAVAEAFRTDEARVLRILKELQQAAPAGVGARDLRECLLIQLASLDDPGPEAPRVRQILENHFEALGSHKYTFIAQQMGISTDEVNHARDFIKRI